MDHDQQAIENIAQAMLVGEREIGFRLEKDVDRGRHSTAAAVPENYDQLHAACKMVDRILEAAQHFGAQTVPRNTDDEQLVRAFVEDQLERHARIGAPE